MTLLNCENLAKIMSIMCKSSFHVFHFAKMALKEDGVRRAENGSATREVSGPGWQLREAAEAAAGGQPGGVSGTAQLGPEPVC